ncbi:Nn.00g045160.m01.CDS01 [Neocucurbitaria sp. VM-36]
MLRTISGRASEMAGSSSRAFGESENQCSSKPRTISKRRISSSKPKVTSKSQTWSNSTPNPRSTRRPTTATATKRALSDPTDTRPVTKRQSRFVSLLFISLLAVSPIAIDFDAADQNTIETAQKAATQHTQPMPLKKAYVRPVGGVRLSDIRKTRWKRFKYELGLKMKSRNNRKGKSRHKWTQIEDVELEELSGEERERQTAKRDDMI